MSKNEVQAIIRRPSTVAATFSGVPSEASRRRMKEAGAEFKNGQWVLTTSDSGLVSEEEAVKAFEALAKLTKTKAA